MGVSPTQSPPSVARDRGARLSAPTSAAGRPRKRGQATVGALASLLGRTDIPWSNTRRSTAATTKRQPGLGRRRSSTSSAREVHAAGFEHRGGSGADVEGAGGRGSTAPGARVSTHGLREVSQILGADVLGPPRTQRPIPRRASHLEGETTGGEGLEMMRGRRRMDTLLEASRREMRRDGITVVDDDQNDIAAEEADGEEDLSIHEARQTSLERGERAEGGKRLYDPMLYRHLPSHEIPLPLSDDDVDDPRSSTVPLGSGSTQDWMGSQLYRHASTPTYTDLLDGRTPAGYDAGLVDLSFGLRSGSGEDLTHTVGVNPTSPTKHTSPSVRVAGPADSRGFVSARRVALSTASVVASRTKTTGLAGCRTMPPSGTMDGEGDDDERAAIEVVDRQFWDDERQRLRSANTSSITRGVARMSVGPEDVFVDCYGGGGEEIASDDGSDDNDEDDDGEMEIRPVGRKRGGSRATTKVRESRTGRQGKKCAEESSVGDGTKSRDFWTVEHMIALIRAKRDQDLHLAGLGHNYGRMKTKTWKWDDVEKRLVQMGVTSRKTVDCGKKWDNLYQQFKSVHKLMGESGKPNFFTLTSGERRERGFNFRMDERVYSEKKAMSRADHTKHPTNLVDTGVPGGVQMPAPLGRRNVSGGSDGGGDGQDDDHGSTRHSSLSGGGGGGAGKRKNARHQIFEAMANVMKEHGSEHTADFQAEDVSMVDAQGPDVIKRLGFGWDGVSREQLAALKQGLVGGVTVTLARAPKAGGIVMTDACVLRQVPPMVGHGQPRQSLPAQQAGASGVEKTPSAQKVDTTACRSPTAAADNTAGSRVAEAADNTVGSRVTEAAEEGRVDDIRRDDGRKDARGGGDDDDDRPVSAMVKRGAKEDDLEERSNLWIDYDAFWV
ncbi:hypothetical protein CBR_g23626 [Chara braunii]|uniref:Myb/SANT-like DNA-binding domain-containing protein n=1 Tax=Chara braunii TaxID=69332 RepID=A0A388L4S3_CHABU|nr:hypothetical protein CBR_g23626 [Chara braunii]|eukprot:GBG77297.1 hypothetical protein CBR_g23626 [Chara braunii]